MLLLIAQTHSPGCDWLAPLGYNLDLLLFLSSEAGHVRGCVFHASNQTQMNGDVAFSEAGKNVSLGFQLPNFRNTSCIFPHSWVLAVFVDGANSLLVSSLVQINSIFLKRKPVLL